MNRVELIGRLTKDSEKRYTTSEKAVCNFTIAVRKDRANKDGEYGADFINCKAFDKNAENIHNYFKKGNQIAISGHINTSSYENKDGIKKYITEVIVDRFDFLDKKTEDSKEQKDEENPEDNKEQNDPFQEFGEQIELKDDELPW